MSNPSRVRCSFDENRDLINIYNSANLNEIWGKKIFLPQKVVEICKGKDFKNCSKELKEFRSKMYSSDLLKEFVAYVNMSWENIEPEYFRRLEKITGKKLEGHFESYVTTIGKCPYNPEDNSFMISLFASIPDTMRTIGHELMHLHFHKHFFGKVEEIVGKDKTHDIKESLTVLLNVEFRDLWFVTDEGYPNHIELRKFILDEWSKKKDFEHIIEKCVKFVLKNERGKDQ